MTEQKEDGSGSSGEAGPFKDWNATANFFPGETRPKPLRVGGQYHLNRRSGTAKLVERVPQGFNEQELLLDLVIDGPGLGGDWVSVEERFPAREGQYTLVRIADADGASIDVEVQEVH